MYPNDADGDALRRIKAHGWDMSQAADIEFVVLVPNRTAADAVATLATRAGYRTTLDDHEDDESWDCYCIKFMVPTYDGVIEAQHELDELSRPFGGHSDGWGMFANGADTPPA